MASPSLLCALEAGQLTDGIRSIHNLGIDHDMGRAFWGLNLRDRGSGATPLGRVAVMHCGVLERLGLRQPISDHVFSTAGSRGVRSADGCLGPSGHEHLRRVPGEIRSIAECQRSSGVLAAQRINGIHLGTGEQNPSDQGRSTMAVSPERVGGLAGRARSAYRGSHI